MNLGSIMTHMTKLGETLICHSPPEKSVDETLLSKIIFTEMNTRKAMYPVVSFFTVL